MLMLERTPQAEQKKFSYWQNMAGRWWVAGLLCLAMTLNYLDRQSLPVVASEIQKEIPLSNAAYARLQSLFLLGYGLKYAGGGRLVDWTGRLAKELRAHGIRVNAMSPGVILTPFREKFTPADRMKALVAGIPQGRAGPPEEVATVVAFLAGPELRT
jgi:hypothetical protein